MLLYGAWIVNTVDYGLQIIGKKRVGPSCCIDFSYALCTLSVAVGIGGVLANAIKSWLKN